MLKQRTIVVATATILFGTALSDNVVALPVFQVVGTFSQDDWGTLNTAASQLLFSPNWDALYAANGVSIGVVGAAGNSATFTTPFDVVDYLPAIGPAGPLFNDLLNPTSTDAGVLGGYALALQFNVDFSDAGLLTGTPGTLFGDLVLVNTAFPAYNGLTVRQYLTEVNKVIGGVPFPDADYDPLATLTLNLTLAFEGGTPTQFAQDHLIVAAAPVPEPATLGLLGIGLVTLTARRFRSKDRSSSQP